MRILVIHFIRALKALSVLSVVFGAITFILLFQLLFDSSSDVKDSNINGTGYVPDGSRRDSSAGKLHERYFQLMNFYSEENNKTKAVPSREYLPLFNYSLWRPAIEDEGVGRDRIIEQLVWFMEPEIRYKIQHSKPKNILLLDHFSKWNIAENGHLQCPGGNHNCRLLANKNSHFYQPRNDSKRQIDAVVLSNWQHDFVKNLPESALKISYFLESPFSPSVRSTQNNTDILASYWRNSDLVAPYAKWVYYNDSVRRKPQGINYAEGKTHKVAIFVSNCLSYNDRLAYTKELGKHIQVDIYGQCGPFKCSKLDETKCLEKLQNQYKFYLSFENANCKDYITEKFFNNALQYNVVPIVLGGRFADYHAAAPYHSFIHTDSFASPKELAAYLTYLDKTDAMYNEYFQWKGTGEFINTHFLCRVCAMLNYAELEHKPPNKPTSAFPWTFKNKGLCLDSHRWSWYKEDVNPTENWDSTVSLNARLSYKGVNDYLSKVFPVYKKPII